jgi:hypothetical protein
MGVDSLGYVAFNVSTFDKWRELLVKVFGMEERARVSSDALDFRLDEYHHRISLYPTGEDSVAVIGWEVGCPDRLEALVADLRARGVEVSAGSRALCDERKVKTVYHYTCPMIGCPTEIYYGPLVSNTPFAPGRGVRWGLGTSSFGSRIFRRRSPFTARSWASIFQTISRGTIMMRCSCTAIRVTTRWR